MENVSLETETLPEVAEKDGTAEAKETTPCLADEIFVPVKYNKEIINLELIFSDIEMIEKRIQKIEKSLKADKKHEFELEICKNILEVLQKGLMAKSINFTEEEKEYVNTLDLLTTKPTIYAANMSEEDFSKNISSNERYKQVLAIASSENSAVVPICAELEAQISEMDENEKIEFLQDIGLEKSGLDRLVSACYELLGLISYLTAGKPEVRAWTIKKGTKAPQAAGKIHTDFERGFIRAEVVSFETLIECGSIASAKDKGLVRSEGKEYVMQDGDVVLFRFNV